MGEKQTRRDYAAYDLCPGDYHSGKNTFPNKTYYNREEVKSLLIQVHQSKCCYCEQKLRTPAYLHVEHFRPKRGVRQARSQRHDDLPGYYWLAYRWENLLLSCHDCNCKFKRTLFPLANPADRARSHHDDVTRERPLFVDPVREDPRNHIRFNNDSPEGITPQGRTTIEELGLRRLGLRIARVELLNQIRTEYELLEVAAANPGIPDLEALAAGARRRIEAAMQPDAEFSSMAIDYVARRGL
ncbi:MAG: hypothetical protein H0X65_13660 [Gemmatimonadetes bacterium]|nr:hypothetical protein [Gemmatimonadota bacterium]